MVRKRVRCAIGCSGVDWFPMYILGGGGGVVQLLYPPLEVGQEYALGTVEAPGREVVGKSPLELLGGSPLEQVGCCAAAWNMAEAGVEAGIYRGYG